MIPQTSDVVVENGDMLPDDLQRALRILSIKEEFFTSQELLKAFKEKYPIKSHLLYDDLPTVVGAEREPFVGSRKRDCGGCACRFDFTALDAVAGSFYKKNGLGRRPSYTGAQLIRILMVRWLMLWSYEVTSTRLRYDWLARWFAGLEIDGPTPSKSTITNFEKWMLENHPENDPSVVTFGRMGYKLPTPQPLSK